MLVTRVTLVMKGRDCARKACFPVDLEPNLNLVSLSPGGKGPPSFLGDNLTLGNCPALFL